MDTGHLFGLILLLGFLAFFFYANWNYEKKKRQEDLDDSARRIEEIKNKTGYDEDKERLKNIKLDLKTAIANTKKKTHTKIIDGTKETYVKINENYSEPLDSISEDIKELKKEIKELEKEIKSKNV